MLKCPLCAFENEDGSLFCEECKTDLSAVEQPVAAVAEAGFADSIQPEPIGFLDLPTPVEIMPPIELQPIGEPFPVAEVVHAEQTPVLKAEPMAPAPAIVPLAVGAQPKLVVIRGQKINAEYPIYPELNFIGRADEKAVDIDLEDQEPPDRVWSSRQHAIIHFDDTKGEITIEDLNSSNGTYVNRNKVHPGAKQPLNANDVIQIGTVHLRLKV